MTPLPPTPLAALWRRLRQQLPARAALVWLLLALVVVPTLGRLHQVEHAGGLAQVRAGHGGQHGPQALDLHGLAHAFPAAGTGATASAESGHAHGLPELLSGLLAPHTSVDCLLLDQLALGDLLLGTPAALPTQVPAQASMLQHAGRLAAPHVALFQARGPPGA